MFCFQVGVFSNSGRDCSASDFIEVGRLDQDVFPHVYVAK